MKKVISCCIAFLVLILSAFVHVNAEVQETSSLFVQACIENNTLDVFISGDLDLQNISTKVSNQQAEIVNCGSISDGGVKVRTTVLVDISTSMPADTRKKVTEFIEEKIKTLSAYEELRLVTFGDEVTVLMDFSSDRYDLSNAVKNIKFNGTASAVYDAINNTIVEAKTNNGSPCFYRTIVMTDGVDDTNEGITKEELFIRLRDDMYPIDVVEVSKNKPQSHDKDLSALSRISNGKYVELYSKADIADCISKVSLDELKWIRSEVPVSLLDGSTRQVDLFDGNNSFSFDMKMSVVDAPAEVPSDSQQNQSSSTQFSRPVFSAPNNSKPTTDATDEGFILEPLYIIIIASVLVIGIVVLIIVIVTINKKSKRSLQNQHSETAEDTGANRARTQIINEPDEKEHYSIKLSNPSNPGESWTVEVNSDIIIGRSETCNVCINEMSVSHEQCKIGLSKDGLVISNLSTSNRTKLNGVLVKTEVVLRPADIIHFGRITLRVDFIQKVTDDNQPQNPSSNNSGRSRTQSMF